MNRELNKIWILVVTGILVVLPAGCSPPPEDQAPAPYQGNLESLPAKVFEPKTGLELILVKPGKFLMGQAPREQGNATELPQHQVKIMRPYYLGRTEVTVAQFREFIEDTGYITDAEKRGKATGWHLTRWGKKRGISWRNPGFKQGDNHPAVCLSFNDARAFCDWLGVGYRLPSEAEWEYAARSGTQTPFVWGNFEEVCLYGNSSDQSAGKLFSSWNTASCDDGYPWTSPVGNYLPNPWGFVDLFGNAWEWCLDPWHQDFKGAPQDQRSWGGADGGGKRVLKGGSWYFEPQDLRPAWRHWHRDYEATNGAGFRVLLDCR